MHGTKVKIIYI